VVALQLGALAVVVETVASGVSALPFARFAMLMLPIHLAIGVVEGIVTAAAVALIRAARPEWAMARGTVGPTRRMLAAIGVATLLVAGVLSWFASSRPDGLEWSTARVTGGEQIQSRASGVGTALERIQTMTSRMPDYAFKSAGESPDAGPDGTSSAGLIGSILTLGLVALVGAGLRRRGARDAKA
jgi:cobalt/nickel transport system permease protein